MHRYEFVTSGNGYWVADENGENRKQVIKQDGTIDVQTEITFGDGEYLADTNDNELLKFSVTSSAVNELTLANAATGSAPVLSATGGDTNVDMRLEPKGTGAVEVYSDEAGATGATLKFYSDSASPAELDYVGYTSVYGKNDAGEDVQYGGSAFTINSVTDGSEDGGYGINLMNGGSLQTQPQFTINGASGSIGVNREDDGATGAALSLNHVSSSPADDDNVGLVKGVGYDDGDNTQEYGQLTFIATDVSDGTEAGALAVKLANGSDGTVEEVGRFQNGGLTTAENVGTAGTSVTAVEYGDGRNHTTVLTITNLAYTVAGAAAEAIGKLIYTFPAGAHAHEVTSLNVTLQGGGTVDADTPDVGVGSVEGTGAVATLDGTATFEDYITGQTASDCSGTAVQALTAATAGYGTGISLNTGGDAKTVYLNMADTWAGADTVTVNGTVVIKWTSMS